MLLPISHPLCYEAQWPPGNIKYRAPQEKGSGLQWGLPTTTYRAVYWAPYSHRDETGSQSPAPCPWLLPPFVRTGSEDLCQLSCTLYIKYLSWSPGQSPRE